MSEKIFLVSIGAKIKEIRASKGMAQHELAALCDFEKATMSRIESGQTNPTVLTLKKVSQALNVPIAELLIEGNHAFMQGEQSKM